MKVNKQKQSLDTVVAEPMPLPAEGFLRIKQIVAPHGPIPVSRSTWWAGVKTGRFPKPKRIFGPRITVWDVRDIRALILAGNVSAAP